MVDTLPIQTASLNLRRFVIDDAATVYAMSRERGMRQWIPDQVYEDTEQASEVLRYLIAQYDNPEAPVSAPLVLGVCLRDSGALIGHVGLSPAAEGVEIGYAIADAHQGRGLAQEAVRAVADWGLELLELPSLFGIVAADNIASWTVLERAGFALIAESSRSLHGATRLVRTYCKRAPSHRGGGGPR